MVCDAALRFQHASLLGSSPSLGSRLATHSPLSSQIDRGSYFSYVNQEQEIVDCHVYEGSKAARRSSLNIPHRPLSFSSRKTG